MTSSAASPPTLMSFDARRRFRMEYRLRRADGEYRWILDDDAPRFTSEGIFAGYIGSCVDITDKRRAEEERQKLSLWRTEAWNLSHVRR